MEVDKLRGSPIGQLVPISEYDPRFGERYDYFAYVPDPLPAELHLDAATYNAVIDASAAMARADQAASLLPNPVLLARPATRREAVSTSALEGTYAALSDVFAADFLDADEITSSVSEVRNYVTAAERAYELIEQGQPISIRMLEDLQRELLRGTATDGPNAGSVRTTQVFIGVGNRRVDSARFVPPPPDHRLTDGLQFVASLDSRYRQRHTDDHSSRGRALPVRDVAPVPRRKRATWPASHGPSVNERGRFALPGTEHIAMAGAEQDGVSGRITSGVADRRVGSLGPLHL